MKLSRSRAALATSVLVFAACSTTSASPSGAPSESAAPSEAPSAAPSEAPSQAPAAKVRVQLQWYPQAQFAGYFAADRQGYFKDENLEVEILPGAADIIPQQVGSAPDGPEFTIAWVPKVLEAREKGSDLVDIAQIFQRSGTLSVTWKTDGITDPCQLAGKKVGVWDFGNEFEVTAGLQNCGLTPGLENGGDPATQFQKVIQAFDMKAFIAHEISAAEAMIYNEYAQVLETTNPATGELYKPEDLNVINWNDYRVAMLQDALWARKSWLDQPGNTDIAVRFVRAVLKGWVYCRDNPADCVKYTAEAGSQLGAGHQAWMMNEINGLIWPSPVGVGVMDPIGWNQTVKIAKLAGVIKADPSIDAYTTEIVKAAYAGLAGDTKGEGFQKATIPVTPGGN
jgi:NitT/TauT family transport system substrate-binding protein